MMPQNSVFCLVLPLSHFNETDLIFVRALFVPSAFWDALSFREHNVSQRAHTWPSRNAFHDRTFHLCELKCCRPWIH